MTKTIFPRRLLAVLFGLELLFTLALPPHAWALTTVEGANGAYGTSGAAELDATTDQLMCTEAPRGAHVTLPSGSTWDINACQTATLASTDICSVTPQANSCPASGTNSKIDIGWLPSSVSTNTATGTMVLTGGTLTRVTGTGTGTGTQTVTSVSSTDTWTYTPASQTVGSFSAIGGVWTKVTGTGTSTGTATASSVASTDTATLTVTYTYTHTHTITDISGAVGTSAQICAEQGTAMKATVTNTGTQTATGTVTGSQTDTATAAAGATAYSGTSTATSTVTSTGTGSATVTATTTATQTGTVSFTTTQTWTMTGTGTGTQFNTATFTKTGTVTASGTATGTKTTTYTGTVTATYSRTVTGTGTRTWTMTATTAIPSTLTVTGTVTNTWSVTSTGTVTGTATGTGTQNCASIGSTPTVVGLPDVDPEAPINTYVPLYLPQQISGGNPVGFCLGPNDTNAAGIPSYATNGMQNAKTASPYLVPANGTIRSIYFGMAGAAISQGGPVSNPYMRIDIYRLNWNTTTLLQTLNVSLDAAKTGINNTTTSGNMMQASVTSIGLSVTAGEFIGVVFVPQSGDNSKINAILNLFGQMAVTFP